MKNRRGEEKTQTRKNKVVLFLVEGLSEQKALQIPISLLMGELDENVQVFFLTMKYSLRKGEENEGGDITSMLDVTPKNIGEKIYDRFLKDFFDKYNIYLDDISEIIHIVDTDGTYVSDEMIFEDLSQPKGKAYYDSDCIKTRNVEGIRKRNKQKTANLNYLMLQDTVTIGETSIPYHVYYFSCNLDHFLNNDANLNPKQKISCAENFMNSHLDGTLDFIKFFSDDPDAAHNMSYRRSWNFIKKEDNSLHRHTNINLLFEHLKNEAER